MSTGQRIAQTVRLSERTPRVCRLGLATRGNTNLSPAHIRLAIDRGVNYLNWCGHEDGMSRAIAALSRQEREQVVLAFQLHARTARQGQDELEHVLSILGTDYVDVATFHYVESGAEWDEILRSGGVMDEMQKAKREGKVRLIGLTTHQRGLGAEWAQTGLLDLLMVRYNAAHTGAEREVFPITRRLGIPVVAFTCLRWRRVLLPTPEDPPGFTVPGAAEWYRFVLANPDVSVALMAPNGRQELLDNLALLENWRPFDCESLQGLRAHGQRVRKHGGSFP